MKGVLVYSEHTGLARELLAFAAASPQAFGACDAAVLGEQVDSRAQTYLGWGAARVFTMQLEALSDELVAEVLARLVEQLDHEFVLLGATRRGRSLAPRLAQRLDAGCVSEAVEIALEDGQVVTSRFALGGNTLIRERIRTACKVIAVVPGAAARDVQASTPPPEEAGDSAPQRSAAEGDVLPVPFDPPATRTQVVRHEAKPPAGADLVASERLVCVGRGLASADDLSLIHDLADALGAEVACTRPLSYEYGWLPEERMIGISGLRASPRLLLSLGVSGQVQHTVGISGSKVIVAVNRDPAAPIFKLADYGIVGDLYQVAPRLAERLRQRTAE